MASVGNKRKSEEIGIESALKEEVKSLWKRYLLDSRSEEAKTDFGAVTDDCEKLFTNVFHSGVKKIDAASLGQDGGDLFKELKSEGKHKSIALSLLARKFLQRSVPNGGNNGLQKPCFRPAGNDSNLEESLGQKLSEFLDSLSLSRIKRIRTHLSIHQEG
mgnify:CR=1 FL=1